MSKALSPFFEYTHRPKLALSREQKIARRTILSRLADAQYKMIEVNCPQCGNHQYDVLLTTDKYGLPSRAVQCQSCCFVYNQTRFDDKSLKDIYQTLYRQIEKPPENTSDEKLFFQEVEKGEAIYKKIQPYAFNTTGWVIEIGCGSGGALIPFKEAGYQVIGFDMDENYLACGRRHGILTTNEDFYDYLKDKNLSISVVIIEQTLEHVFDLNDFLKKLRQLISKETIIYVGVPGLKNIHRHYLGNILEYFAFFHLYHFDSARLTSILCQHQFQVLSIDEGVSAISTGSWNQDNQHNQSASFDVRPYLLETHQEWYHQYLRQRLRDWLNLPYRILRRLLVTIIRA